MIAPFYILQTIVNSRKPTIERMLPFKIKQKKSILRDELYYTLGQIMISSETLTPNVYFNQENNDKLDDIHSNSNGHILQ